MIDFENIQRVVVKGLKEHCKCPVVCSNQAEPQEEYSYISYTITLLAGENNGSYSVYEDGTEIKHLPHNWSITAVSDDDTKSKTLALKAREWIDRVGATFLFDNNVNVISVGSVTNRDNFITVGYEYRNGFDIFFSVEDIIEGIAEQDGYIEAAEIGGINIDKPPSDDELIERLARRLDGEVV